MEKILSTIFIVLFVIGLFIGAKSVSTEIETEKISMSNEYLEGIKKLCIAEDAFGRSSINISKFRNSAVIETEYGILSAYYNEDGIAKIILLDLKENIKYEMELTQKVEESILGDGHCSISIGYNDTIVYFAYGAHATKCYYGSFSINDFYKKKEISDIKVSQINMTYPQFYNNAGKLYLVFRNDENNSWCYSEMEPDCDIQSGKENVFLYSENGNTLYINDIAISTNDKYVAIPFVERLAYNPDEDLIKNNGIYLLFSETDKSEWESMGNILNVPAELEECKKVIDIGEKENLMNQDSAFVTDNGKVFITRMSDDENGIPQIWLTTYDKNKNLVDSIQISENEEDFDLKGTGTLVLPLSRAQVLVSDRFVHVIYRQNKKIMISSLTIDAGGGDVAVNVLPLEI